MANVPAVLRYGRYHGICHDYHKEDPLCKLEEADLLDVHDIELLPDLLDFAPPYADPPTDSKLQLSQQASKLLISAKTQPPFPGWRSLLSDRQEPQLRKVEMPLILTDHEKDMRRFLPKRSLGPQDIDFHLEILSEENDEGLSWPTSTRTIRAQWDKDIARERLQISKDSLQHLRYTLQNDWTQDDHKCLIMNFLTPEKKSKLQPISPPLIPDDPVCSPLAKSSPVLRLSLTSDAISLTSLPTESPPRGPAYDDYGLSNRGHPAEYRPLEFHPEYFQYEDDELIDYDAGEPSSSTITEEKTDKNDNILGPMSGNEFVPVRSLFSPLSVPRLPPYNSVQLSPLPSVPVAEGTVLPFQDENLHKRSITAGSPLRKRDVSPTKSAAFSENLETLTPDILHGVKIPFDLKLLAEDLEGNGYEPTLPKDVIKSHQMLWKPEKLSVLKEDDDEEDLVLEFHTEKFEIGDEYKLEIKHENSPRLTESSPPIEEAFEEPSYVQLAKNEQEDPPHLLPGAKRALISQKRKPLEDIINDAKRQHVMRVGDVSKFSASGSLSSFLHTRQEMPAPHVEEVKIPEKHADVLVPGTPEPATDTRVPENTYITVLGSSRTIFFSTSYLQIHHSLLRFFEVWAGTTLNIVYRNLEIPMLLSPKRAVMMTSLQALTQRPLPGHGSGGKSATHDQISLHSRANAFEFLIVLVSTPTFTGNDHNTIGAFTAYCESVSRGSACHILPMYVQTGEANLHSSIAKLVLEYGFYTEDIVFLEDESNWESFLVRAGMNSFAAQVVLGLLKDDGSGGPWGLRAFVQMDVAEREARFESVVGRNVLERVRRGIETAVGRGELM